MPLRLSRVHIGVHRTTSRRVEPAANRFCLRCCSSADDQVNCNSHQDRTGCPNAIPGTYSFPDLGVSCDQ